MVDTVDGLEVTDMVFRVTGQLRLNRQDPVHRAYMDALRLGTAAEIACYCFISAKGQRYQAKTDSVEHTVVATLDSIELPDL